LAAGEAADLLDHTVPDPVGLVQRAGEGERQQAPAGVRVERRGEPLDGRDALPFRHRARRHAPDQRRHLGFRPPIASRRLARPERRRRQARHEALHAGPVRIGAERSGAGERQRCHEDGGDLRVHAAAARRESIPRCGS
jgi:hypothetical protein